MQTDLTYHIFRPGALKAEEGSRAWNGEFRDIRAFINETVEGKLEHVSVLFNGRRADMFVEEKSALAPLPLNELATKIYRAATMAREPETIEATLPKIYGNAIVFDQRVWS